ncbi:hypothetical protein CPC16_011586 [Podila verticillata]|nr:hypothetical protein BGZ59_011041 [Podila verticillata]KAF9377909.1 hypothetical protein CPC16_011586 [Podila verticillata]KAI9242684.1 MAG: hypothetical protein BYD32DRAFT_402330 [Podila humilis]KFH65562.1 hypothetical protein MVEG_09038 [Podila verticillata NRRL 6337]
MDSIRLFDQSALTIQDCGSKGRGVVTSVHIPARTTIDLCPILLFPTEEYTLHGQFTQLDHYTYRWLGGMALALGLGSMFNHSKEPNVGFQRDFENKMIRYSTLRDVAPGEELCISYGPNLWFPDMEDEDDAASKDSGYQGSGSRSPRSEFSDSEDETGDRFLSRLQIDNDEE